MIRNKLVVLIIFSGLVLPAIPVLAQDDGGSRDAIVAGINSRVGRMVKAIDGKFGKPSKQADVTICADRARNGTWTEIWPDEKRDVRGEIWNDAIQAALDACGEVFIPGRKTAYYLDGPIILKSGQRLRAAPDAEIRLRPGTDTCLVRNEHLAGFREGPVPADLVPDTDILVEGGIWTTLYFGPGMDNGNKRGRSDAANSVPGCHGLILLENIRSVVVRNLTIRQSRCFGVHIGNGNDFLVENILFENHGRDGVHVIGNSSYAIVRNISGTMDDDPVALNAWEWANYSVVWGPIHHILVENIQGATLAANSTDSIRILPGVKRFPDGSTLDCFLSDIVIRDIEDIREFKLYNQPNLEMGRKKDFSAGVGRLRNMYFEKLIFNRPGSIQIHADTDGLNISDVKLNFPLAPDYRLIEIGPKSRTYKFGSNDPKRWTEIFSPDINCTVRNLHTTNIRTGETENNIAIDQLVRIIEQKLNPDYPKTTPRGGTGRGIWVRDP